MAGHDRVTAYLYQGSCPGTPPVLVPFLTVYTQDHSLTATLIFDDGSRIPTAKETGQDSLLIKCSNRDPKSRKGGSGRCTSQGRSWLRDYPPHNDKSRFPFSRDRVFYLTCGQDSMANKSDYVELGLACADVCEALNRGINGRRADDLSQSVREAIEQLAT